MNFLFLEEELYIANKLGMTEFEITIERGPWDLEIIIDFIQRLKMMKCTFQLECDREVFAVNKEDGIPRWHNHYSMSIGCQIEMRKKYKRIDDIIRDVENTFVDFQDTFIKTKATIAIFKSNKTSLENYQDLLNDILNVEKRLDSLVLKTIQHATGTLRAESYQIYLMMK